MKYLLALSVLFSFSSMATDLNDRAAVIGCDVNSYGSEYGYSYGRDINDKEGHWEIVLDNCNDGDNRYEVTFKQHKFFNLDFLIDKKSSDSVIKIQCIGTEITGAYTGVNAGLGLLVGVQAGAYVSVLGNQAVCLLLRGDMKVGGVDVSPQKMIIKKL